MLRTIGTIAILVLATGTVEAQNVSVGGAVAVDGYHSSTAAEGYLRGRGAALTGAGNYLESLGNYQNLNQMARRRAYENWVNRVRTRWDLKDEYKARQRRDNPSWPERRMRQLDMIEARAAVLKREEEMRAKGLLPPKPVPGFTHKGVRYKNYSEFRTTPAFREMIAERDARFAKRDAEKAAEKARYDAAVRFLAKRSRMNPITRVFHDQRVARERNVRRIMGEAWWNKYESTKRQR